MMNFGRPITELIMSRRSTRTMTGGDIESKSMHTMNDACTSMTKAPFGEAVRIKIIDRPTNSTEVKLGDYGLQRNPRYFIIGAIKSSPTAREGYGYLLEHLVLKAQELNLGTCWLGLFNREYFSDFKTSQDELVPAIISLGVPAEKMRFSEKMMRSAVRANARKDWKKLFFDGDFTRPLAKEASGQYAEPLEMLRLAPSSGNSQPWRILKGKDPGTFYFYIDKVKKNYYESGMNNIDIGIAMCHFELTARAKGLDGSWAISNPSVREQPGSYEYRVTWSGR